MASDWPTRLVAVASLHLDHKNPRLGREVTARAPREIIQYLFEHDKAMDVASSIATRGYFPNEPLLAIREGERYIVVEGNRRLAALKALREPGLLDGSLQRQVEVLSRRVADPDSIAKVPVTVAPTRQATDKQIAGRHVGTPVLAWEAENRASFILDKLTEGYDNDRLRVELGFSLADIQKARQIRAIADMARSLDLSEEIKAKLENPRAKVFTTLGRVFDSSVGKQYLMVVTDADHGLRGKTTKPEFVRGFKKLVSDVALGKQSSRSLNTNEDMQKYFESWNKDERPAAKRGTFVPADVVSGKSVASPQQGSTKSAPARHSRTESKTIIPKTFKVRVDNDRLLDIHRELTKLKREEYPNAGAVLLRVFFELAVIDYLERTGEMAKITAKLKSKEKLQFEVPTMRQLVPEVIRIAKQHLTSAQANSVEKAIQYNKQAPFTLSDMHAFVHQPGELPGERDIRQFWNRIEPLMRLLLEQDSSTA